MIGELLVGVTTRRVIPSPHGGCGADHVPAQEYQASKDQEYGRISSLKRNNLRPVAKRAVIKLLRVPEPCGRVTGPEPLGSRPEKAVSISFDNISTKLAIPSV